MPIVSLTGQDTHKLQGRILENLAPGDCVVFESDGDMITSKRGKNGNVIHALNESGKLYKAIYRVLSGSPDDRFFQALLSAFENDFASAPLLIGESMKRFGSGGGQNVIYSGTGGVIRKKPSMKSNSDGDTEQAITTWEVTFANAVRTIG